MSTYPLAIYTARHGLGWEYPREEISFGELDACRKAFSPLPDFDAGAKGFEGVWAKGDRVFIVRCQSVAAWDFRGRSATYLAVTWIPRTRAASVDYERLLAASPLAVPSKDPSFFFEAGAEVGSPREPVASEAVLTDGFARAGAIIAGTPLSAMVLIRRVAGARQATCHVSGGAACCKRDSERHSLPTPSSRGQSQPSINLTSVVMALAIVWLLTLVAATTFGLLWRSERRVNENLTNEVREMTEAMNRRGSTSRWLLMEFPGRTPEIFLVR